VSNNFTGFGLCVKCSKYQQLKLAKYCDDILDDYLLRRPLDSTPVTNLLVVLASDLTLFHPVVCIRLILFVLFPASLFVTVV